MRIEPLGDRALQLVLGDAPDEPTRRRVAAAWRRLRALPGVTECVPGFTTLTIHFDPLRFPVVEGAAGSLPSRAASVHEGGLAALVAAVSTAGNVLDDAPGRVVEIPVRYGGEDGPDLEEVAALHGISADEVVALHAAGEYRVHLIGFVPGFPYLGGLDARLHTPRRDSPRTVVPAGSVGIGGAQTGVYPIESPGGWRLIGRTPLPLFDPLRDPPALLRAGDIVRFRPVDA